MVHTCLFCLLIYIFIYMSVYCPVLCVSISGLWEKCSHHLCSPLVYVLIYCLYLHFFLFVICLSLWENSSHHLCSRKISVALQVQMGELGAENQRLQVKLRSVNESHQRTIRSLEARVTALTDDLDIARNELQAVQSEYENYKVSVVCWLVLFE